MKTSAGKGKAGGIRLGREHFALAYVALFVAMSIFSALGFARRLGDENPASPANTAVAVPGKTTSAGTKPFTDAEVNARVDALLGNMTVDEKIGQLNQLFYGFATIPNKLSTEERIAQGQIGSYLFITSAAITNQLQHVAVEKSRLHIPLLFGFDVIHGLRTIFPAPIALAASWDPEMVEKAEIIAAREASSVGVRWTFAPMVDIARDPRWGRIVEGPGEDPFLASAMARAEVRGFQGPFVGSPEHIIACMKHFAGYGAADGGRDYDSAFIPEDQLHNVYLAPFHAGAEAGSFSVMSAYMDLNDVPATGNRFLLQDVLRDDWKFQGFVVSDAFAIPNLTTHGFARDVPDAALRAFNAGVNMDMGSETYLNELPALVRQKRITMQALDDTVRPILAAKVRLGLFENPYVDESRVSQVLVAPENREAAKIAAERSAVLLKNENHLLPLNKSINSVAVIGPLADSPADTLGPWSFGGDTKDTVMLLHGIQAKVSPGSHVESSQGVDIWREYPSFIDVLMHKPAPAKLSDEQLRQEIAQSVEIAKRADTVVMVLGEFENMSGEYASRASLALPGKQEELLEAVVATGKPVVLVLLSGRPLNISWAAGHVPAILEAWYPGTEGGNAVADLLFGDAAPGGKLPVTWPRDEGQIPIYYAHNLTHDPESSKTFQSRYWDESSFPLYPFGFGLSYTSFEISDLHLDRGELKLGGDRIGISASVKNTGSRGGDEVVQLYVHQQAGSASRPVRELKGFQRVTLAPGENKTVDFTLGKDELSFWSSAEHRWVFEAEAFDIWVGEDSTAQLHSTFRVVH